MSSNANRYSAVCRYVVDGDSLYLQGVRSQIRLWGVDAPERAERGYIEATRALRKLALDQPLLCIEKDIDQYQRIVARCFAPAEKSGEWIELNQVMIEGGSAQEYCWFSQGFYGFCDG